MSSSAAELNARFALAEGALAFREGPQGLLFADIETPLASASICAQGAQLLAWRPRAQATPVVWLSEDAVFAPQRAIRGGIPICWPWFGPHPDGGERPSHGFARIRPWSVAASRQLDSGETEIAFVLHDDAQTRVLWPHGFSLELRLTIGTQLRAELSTANRGTAPFEIGEALHSYYRVGDIGAIEVQGLDGLEYADATRGGARARQAGSLRFEAEFDRAFLDVGSDITVVDPVLRRRICITAFGARSAIVWNPWVDKAARLGDLGKGREDQGAWREMVCVESGNVLDNRVRVAPGSTHRMAALVRVEAP